MFFLQRLGAEEVCQAACKDARTGNQRTDSKHLQKFPAGPGAPGHRIHGLSPSANLAAKCSAGAGRVRRKLLSDRRERKRALQTPDSFCAAQSMRESCPSFLSRRASQNAWSTRLFASCTSSSDSAGLDAFSAWSPSLVRFVPVLDRLSRAPILCVFRRNKCESPR